MKPILVLLTIALLVSACSSKSNGTQAGNPLNMATAFAPDPPKQGAETITVTLTDANGAPVKGAAVEIASTMPTMSMFGPKVSASDNGDGTYGATMKLNYATQWKFSVSASFGDKKATQQLSVDVK